LQGCQLKLKKNPLKTPDFSQKIPKKFSPENPLKFPTWFRANRMAVNISKTKYMIFKPKNKKVTINQGEGINERGGYQDPGKMYELFRIYNDNPVVSDRAR
jgi:hypothetical protein